MTNDTDTTPADATGTSWLPTLSSVTTWKHVVAVAIAAVAGLAYFDRLPVIAWRSDPVMQEQINGLGVITDEHAARIKAVEATAAAKSDIAEIRARLDALEKPKTGSPVTTGSISKKR